jgi:hypothetical protein
MTDDPTRSNPTDNPIDRLTGEKIASVYFQGSLRMDIGLDPSYLLRIEGQCGFNIDGEDFHFRGTPYDSTIERLQAIVGHQITSACAHEDGRLELILEGGDSITSSPDGKFEPWQISGPDGFLVVSMPSGALEIW